jgi:hypothetical protein
MITKGKKQRRNNSNLQELVIILFISYIHWNIYADNSNYIVSLMRHEIHVELKRDDEDGKLEESKEEDVP